MIACDEEQGKLVCSREGAIDFGRQLCTFLSQIPCFHGGLGVRAVIIMPLTEIGKDAALGIFEEQAVDRMVLCAALEPVLQIFGRDGELQGQHFRRLILCECA